MTPTLYPWGRSFFYTRKGIADAGRLGDGGALAWAGPRSDPSLHPVAHRHGPLRDRRGYRGPTAARRFSRGIAGGRPAVDQVPLGDGGHRADLPRGGGDRPRRIPAEVEGGLRHRPDLLRRPVPRV